MLRWVSLCANIRWQMHSEQTIFCLSVDLPWGLLNRTPPRNPKQIIDDVSEDQVIETGFDVRSFTQVTTVIHAFKQFIDQNADELAALQILCRMSEAQEALTEDNLKTLEAALLQHSNNLSRESLWLAYKNRSPESVRGETEQRTDLISLVRFAMGHHLFLEPFSAAVNRNFEEWLNGKDFNSEQKDHPDPLIALVGTLECDVTDLGERHDDYIVATLLAELWGDADE